ncbi:hypothetical protein Pan161_05980 [Gimesia algae]|uniref:Uncharacterized protein n=1 Tax=Gimesia algae TaxID=2527971 RepID=A0A517V7L8_9PLAN|nr:hypothetical protein Pan161_05980 [Gimesia algae]
MELPICDECGETLINRQRDMSEPENWCCPNSRCIRSYHHEFATCDVCGGAPAVITNGGTGYTDFLCENGHKFMTRPHTTSRQQNS